MGVIFIGKDTPGSAALHPGLFSRHPSGAKVYSISFISGFYIDICVDREVHATAGLAWELHLKSFGGSRGIYALNLRLKPYGFSPGPKGQTAQASLQGHKCPCSLR